MTPSVPAPNTYGPMCMPASGRFFIVKTRPTAMTNGGDGADERPRARVDEMVVVVLPMCVGVPLGHLFKLRPRSVAVRLSGFGAACHVAG
jgi:hypothetical protein